MERISGDKLRTNDRDDLNDSEDIDCLLEPDSLEQRLEDGTANKFSSPIH